MPSYTVFTFYRLVSFCLTSISGGERDKLRVETCQASSTSHFEEHPLKIPGDKNIPNNKIHSIEFVLSNSFSCSWRLCIIQFRQAVSSIYSMKFLSFITLEGYIFIVLLVWTGQVYIRLSSLQLLLHSMLALSIWLTLYFYEKPINYTIAHKQG